MPFEHSIFIEKFEELVKEGKIKVEPEFKNYGPYRQWETKNEFPLKFKMTEKTCMQDF